jgi:hypothetical protein
MTNLTTFPLLIVLRFNALLEVRTFCRFGAAKKWQE